MVENVNEGENGTDFLYEVDASGNRTLVRSYEALQRAFLRFTNRTLRPVDVFWRDYNGVKQFYVRIEPGKHYNINSYITHPWEFIDSATKERYVVNNKLIFRAPESVGGMMFRTNWNITVPTVRSLRFCAMMSLMRRVEPEQVASLGLPRTLADELRHYMLRVRRSSAPQPVA
ncbi:hypothetical protein JYU34_014902 [Plutella xylostella]|uniref:Uncharacterized protein n=2 Tax=Plutella xylostella TaxID=51655 RepID=A0ABQ7Q9I3_PLUXY|nr:von Hippel-Lindau-like protein [Plutella xylostella]KAG7300608.1 hypothetical protein JYU34_014902 [Plutella xylostella]CAG9131245.1 unnamed protein product [Plutella xylostella]